ncbi:MAG TPA: hypothetical protein VGB02_21320 [Pyrinomonadaceae bacterium]|jgi:hypothetical protein
MKIVRILILAFIATFFSTYSFAQSTSNNSNLQFLTWDKNTAFSMGETWLVKGRVGGFFDGRILETNKSYNYKLRATLMSPEAIRAAARLEQLRSRLTDDETLSLVSEAEQENLVILVEIDPREGSGVIPNDWRAFINSKNSAANESIRGIEKSNLRNYKALQPVVKRDYDYDLFWVSFSFKDKNGVSLWKSVPNELELIVGINEKEGKVTWKVTDALRLRIETLLKLESEKSK